MSRIVVFGATGYTGGLTSEVLAKIPDLPGELVLAGRNLQKLTELANSLDVKASLSLEVADVDDPSTVRALLRGPDDVLISTVGPFRRWGRPAIEAAIDAGCTYLDSTGEPAFIRQVFQSDDIASKASGARLLTGFGHDYLPGNLAGALALRDVAAGPRRAHRIDIGYFMPGGVRMSSGTASSAAGIILEPSHVLRSKQVKLEAAGRRSRTFELEGRQVGAVSVGGTEVFGLPGLEPNLADVCVYIGVGQWARLASAATRGLEPILKFGPAKVALDRLAQRLVKGSRGGPELNARAGVRSISIAEVFDDRGLRVARSVVEGPSPYDLTAEALAWAARSAPQIAGVGALAPAQAFGVDGLVAGCRSFGLMPAAG